MVPNVTCIEIRSNWMQLRYSLLNQEKYCFLITQKEMCHLSWVPIYTTEKLGNIYYLHFLKQKMQIDSSEQNGKRGFRLFPWREEVLCNENI